MTGSAGALSVSSSAEHLMVDDQGNVELDAWRKRSFEVEGDPRDEESIGDEVGDKSSSKRDGESLMVDPLHTHSPHKPLTLHLASSKELAEVEHHSSEVSADAIDDSIICILPPSRSSLCDLNAELEHTEPTPLESSFVCFTTPERPGQSPNTVPLLLLSQKETEAWRRETRRQSAPAKSTEPCPTASLAELEFSATSHKMESRRSSDGLRMSGHQRIISSDFDRPWPDLKRSFSLGSSSTHSGRSGRYSRRLSSVIEKHETSRNRTSRANMMVIESDTGSTLPSPMMIAHDPIPSVPVSPLTAATNLFTPHGSIDLAQARSSGDFEGVADQQWLLDDHLVSLRLFPRPPCRHVPTSRFNSLIEDDVKGLGINGNMTPTTPLFSSDTHSGRDTTTSEDNRHTQFPCLTEPNSTPSSTLPPSPISRTASINEKDAAKGPLMGPPLDRSTIDGPNPLLTPIAQRATLASGSSSPTTTTTTTSSSSSFVAEETVSTPNSNRKRTMGWNVESEVTPPLLASSALPSHSLPQKHTPTLPTSTRTSLTPSTSNHDLPSPPTSYSTLSRRHSKFTTFSGSSSASSVRSLESTSSLKYALENHPWGGRPDISTVFEVSELDSVRESETNHGTEAHVDLARAADFTSSDQKGPSSNDSHPKDGDTSEHSPNLPSDPPSTAQTSSPLLLPLPFIPLKSRTPPIRNSLAGTVHSQDSRNSGKSTKSLPHPFASVVVRPSSPPLVPSFGTLDAPLISTWLSSPNLAKLYKMQALSAAPAHQVTLAEENYDDGDRCPVCHESLSADFRLAGEKPLVVAECGHEVHYACFEMCYGEVPAPGSRKQIGVCGICRQPMRVAESAGRRKNKSNKLALLAGLETESQPLSVRDRGLPAAPSVTSVNETDQDPLSDDPLVPASLAVSSSSRSTASDMQQHVVVPYISVKSEFTSVSKARRANNGHFLTTMISVTVPPAPERSKYPPASRPLEFPEETSPRLPPSPRSDEISVDPHAGAVPSANGAFAHVIRDLENRVTEYRQSGLDAIGPLRLFDLLSVRKGNFMREFNVYLFQDALICITEEKKSGIRNFLSGSSSRSASASSKTATLPSGRSCQTRGSLKLKGRIYLRHVSRIMDSSTMGELSLTIVMTDERMDPFILIFRERGSHGLWKRNLETIVRETKAGNVFPSIAPPNTAPPDLPAKSPQKIAQLTGNGAPVPRAASIPSRSNAFSSSATSPTTSFGDMMRSPSTADFSAHTPPTSAFSSLPSGKEATAGDLVYTAPLASIHTPIDLVVILSLKALSNGGSQQAAAQMKNKIMRQTLAFVLASLGPRDRVSLVTAEQGPNGVIRKTPLLNPTRYDSRQRLESFVNVLGNGRASRGEFDVDTSLDERVDVVTAMNVALDIVLQRKARNPLGALVVISDSVENIKRAQMDLVTARLDAANLPVHSIGYGKGHDPSPLWMFSNHTHATYTYVKDWYDLQKAMAGVIGGLISIAMTNMKLHLACSDNEYKAVRVGGVSESIISQGGKEVEIDLREMRFGETRELLVEIDLVNPPTSAGLGRRHSGETTRSDGQTTHFDPTGSRSASSGMESSFEGLNVSDSQRAMNEALYESSTIDEEPVFEVNCSYHDPAANRSVTRLSQPVLLVVAVLPPSAGPSTVLSDPIVIRRRMEVLASDMITRALLIASRKNLTQATRVLTQTKTVVVHMIDRMRASLPAGETQGRPMSTKRELITMASLESLEHVLADLDILIDSLTEQPDMFDRDSRNFAAQQAIVLRTQKSWTAQCATQGSYMGPGSREMVNIGAGWSGR